MKLTTYLMLAALFAIAPATTTLAEVPGALSYQAYLTDTSGTPIDQTVSVDFALYSSETGGTAKWSDTLNVAVDKGLLSVELGAGVVPFPNDLFSTPLWLGISVGGDAEMTPRRRVSSSAFALKAADADTLAGNTLEDVLAFAQSGGIPPGARIPILSLTLDSQNVNLTGLDMALDGRSVDVSGDFQDGPLSAWAPLVLEYTYPLNSPSPLGNSPDSGVLFNTVQIDLADDSSFFFRITGSSVAINRSVSDVVDTGAPATARMPDGVFLVRETVELEGSFDFEFNNAPPYAGPLEVSIAEPGTTPNEFFAQGRAPQSVTFGGCGPTGCGPTTPLDVVLLGLGPHEFRLIQNDHLTGTAMTTLDLSLSGTPISTGSGCVPSSIKGLSPVVLDMGGTPVNSVLIDQFTFKCLDISVP